ncbi:hypothetical protein ACM66B_004540 [Microbotryomycetes sp. NB124-2]
MTDDARFAKRLSTDPRFKRAKHSKHKVVVDDRFKKIFNEDEDDATGQGGRKRKVDKYGRKLQSGDRNAERQAELKRFYRLKEDQDEQTAREDTVGQEEDDKAPTMMDYARGQVLMESSDEESEDEEEDERKQDSSDDDDSSEDDVAVTLAPAHLRRQRQLSRSPSIDLSETEPAFDQDGQEDEEEEEDEDAEATKRVAVVNMDWDHIRASDLYRVLSSSLSATASSTSVPAPMKGKNGEDKLSSKLSIAPGRLLHLRIYPSQFGRERMEKEEREGPPIEVFGGKKDSEDEDDDHETLVLGRMKARVKKSKSKRKQRGGDDDEDEEPEEELTTQDLIREQLNEGDEQLDNEALRKYQLERLRYYYAVATFDTPAAAAHVVSQVQGTEFERTANILDLQYVPDEVSFDDDPVHDEATEASVAAEGSSYQANEFVTDALRHSKVKLTWDADDPHRKSKIESVLDSIYGNGKNKKGGRDINDEELRAFIASSSDEGELQKDEDDEQDDFFEQPEADGKKLGKDKRSQMRAMLGLNELAQQAWDGSKAVSGKGGKGRGEEMQITFAPALSGKKGALDSDSEGEAGDKQETSIEKYKRKEKERRERKKAERQAKRDGKPVAGPEDGGEDTGPGGFDDDFFADDGKDPFAAYDAGEFGSGDEGVKKGKKLSKAEKRKAKQAAEEAAKGGNAELELLIGSDDEDVPGSKHFDMRKIVKAEKNKGKKKRTKGKKSEDSVEPVNDTFEIDLKDERFKSVHEDYDYAIDPTNPKFQKTRNMQALLSEGRKRRSKKQDTRAPVASSPEGKGVDKLSATGGEDNLRRLVESVKRKAGEEGGRGKRAKV